MKLFNIPNKKMFLDMNWALFITTLVLFFIGFVNLYSASSIRFEDGIIHTPFYERQLIWGGVGLIIIFFVSFINYKVLENFSLPFYLFVLILLILVPVLGKPLQTPRSC